LAAAGPPTLLEAQSANSGERACLGNVGGTGQTILDDDDLDIESGRRVSDRLQRPLQEFAFIVRSNNDR